MTDFTPTEQINPWQVETASLAQEKNKLSNCQELQMSLMMSVESVRENNEVRGVELFKLT